MTKSGTNKFHGGIFEFIRNDKLDARNYFSATRADLKAQPGVWWRYWRPSPRFRIFTTGKIRYFFFVDYEAQRLRQGLVESGTVPKLNAQREMVDFTAAGLKTIYDPTDNNTQWHAHPD